MCWWPPGVRRGLGWMRASDWSPRTTGARPTQALGAAPSQPGAPRQTRCWEVCDSRRGGGLWLWDPGWPG